MKQTPLRLTDEDQVRTHEYCTRGWRSVREVNRAHILAALHKRVPERYIMAVLGISRSTIGRTRQAYVQEGWSTAILDAPRAGRPRCYHTDQEAQIVALACSTPPAGAKRWTVRLLAATASRQRGLRGISRETIRRFLKKTF